MSYQPLRLADVENEQYEHEKGSWTRVVIDHIYRLMSTLCVLLLAVMLVVDIIVHIRQYNHAVDRSWATSRIYGSDENYMSLDHKYDTFWNDDLLGNTSLIKTSGDPAGKTTIVGAIGMSVGEQDSFEGQVTGLIPSRFHQLHCLVSLREALQRATEGVNIGIDQHDDDHWPHCFHYLRQGILCSADDTVEVPAIVNGVMAHTISGSNDVRQCRDANHLYILRADDGIDAHVH